MLVCLRVALQVAWTFLDVSLKLFFEAVCFLCALSGTHSGSVLDSSTGFATAFLGGWHVRPCTAQLLSATRPQLESIEVHLDSRALAASICCLRACCTRPPTRMEGQHVKANINMSFTFQIYIPNSKVNINM